MGSCFNLEYEGTFENLPHRIELISRLTVSYSVSESASHHDRHSDHRGGNLLRICEDSLPRYIGWEIMDCPELNELNRVTKDTIKTFHYKARIYHALPNSAGVRCPYLS
jgi:hypothetical protein